MRISSTAHQFANHMLVWGPLFLLFLLFPVAVMWWLIRLLTPEHPVWRLSLTVWLLVGTVAWFWLLSNPLLPSWLAWMRRDPNGWVSAAVLAAPVAGVAALLARLRYHYPD
jgi:hypothetical protein